MRSKTDRVGSISLIFRRTVSAIAAGSPLVRTRKNGDGYGALAHQYTVGPGARCRPCSRASPTMPRIVVLREATDIGVKISCPTGEVPGKYALAKLRFTSAHAPRSGHVSPVRNGICSV